MAIQPGRVGLEAILRRCQIVLRPHQYDALWTYHRLLRNANEELNLTRIRNFENMVLKHYVDSLLVLNFEDLPSPLIDMGSGPGLPGIPLKIARPEVTMILAEPRAKRAAFLERVCERLGLKDVEVYARKIGWSYDRPPVQGVITRAVATIGETLDRVERCLIPGGRMLFMKGPDCDDEIREALRTHSPSFRLAADHAYAIPGTTHDRRLVVFERTEAATTVVEGPTLGSAREITSEVNPTFKLCKDLLQGGKAIRKHGQALVSGPRVVSEVVARHPDIIEAWLTDSSGPPPPVSNLRWLRLADGLFREVDVAGTHAPLLMVRVPAIPDWHDEDPWPAGCSLFVPFQDPENVGAVIRTAAAFGVARVILLTGAAHPFHPRSVRAAGTTLFQVPLLHGPPIGELQITGAPLIALHTEGPAIDTATFPTAFGLVVGVEGPGLPSSLRGGQTRRIPISASVESLNAAAATAVALYEWRRQASMLNCYNQ